MTSGHPTTPPFVRGLLRPTWHIASHVPSGYGVWTLCGQSYARDDFFKTDNEPKANVCKRCRRIEAGRA